MAVTILPFIRWISLLTQIVYPFLLTVNLTLDDKASHPRMVQWTVYWMIFSLFGAIEANVLIYVIDFIPLYYEIKFLGFLWLAIPRFHGAALLWYKYASGPARVYVGKAIDLYDQYVPIQLRSLMPLRTPIPSLEAEAAQKLRTE